MYLGNYVANSVVDFKFNSQSQEGSSITMGADGTIRIYKSNSLTQRTSLSGVTFVEDFDGMTGVHHLTINLADNTDPGFYAAGSDYDVVVVGAVVDGQTVNTTLAHFSIERGGFPTSAAIAAAVHTTTMTESYAADGAAGTLAQVLYMIQQLMAEKAVVGTTMTVKKLDGATTAATYTLNSATTPTTITRAT